MNFDDLKNAALARAAREAIADIGDLARREWILAKAEIASKLSVKTKGLIWLAIAGIFLFFAVGLLAQGRAFAIAAAGVALHWAFLIVALLFAVLAGAAFMIGRNGAKESLTPTRTIKQVHRDITAVKERLT
jgi:hypothetical protein